MVTPYYTYYLEITLLFIFGETLQLFLECKDYKNLMRTFVLIFQSWAV